MTKRRSRPGPGCRCDSCEAERAGKEPSIKPGIWCARCGHGYLDLRTGCPDDAKIGCTKCGAVGQFVESKPTEFLQ